MSGVYTGSVTVVGATSVGSYSVTVAPSSGRSTADYYTDGVADDVEINQALTDIRTAGGGKLFLKEGLYIIASTLLVGSNTVVEGESINDVNFSTSGGGTKLKRYSSFDGP